MNAPGKNSFLKLPFHPDPQKLQQDLDACLALNWKQHFNHDDYSGDWSGIALRSSSGNETDILSHPGAGFKDTPLLEACPYFRELLLQIECEKETVRLLRLAPGSVIKEHRDRGAGYQFGNFRLHIVIRTHENVSFIVDRGEVPMKTGECWYADFDRPHSVANNGDTDRVHLIIDCNRNEWSDKLFAEAGYDFSLEKKGPDDETFKRMIAELERMNTETARSMIVKMKSERNGNMA
jgi:quercetin dioxygenase-like cupin family protein